MFLTRPWLIALCHLRDRYARGPSRTSASLPSTVALLLCFASSDALAFDSYRYLHVSIDTPWAIFLFLLPVVMSPLILMAFLYWRFANKRSQEQKPIQPPEPDETVDR